MNATSAFPKRNSLSRRGSIMLLVLALLAVLTLIATTLIFVSRLETLAAHNAAKRVQDRMAAHTGVTPAVQVIAPALGKPVATTQDWARTESKSSYTQKARAGQAQYHPDATNKNTAQNAPPLPATPWLAVRDMSGLVNLNTVLDYPDKPAGSAATTEDAPIVGALPAAALESLVAAICLEKGIEANARAITQNILKARYGPDGEPDPEETDQPEPTDLSAKPRPKDDTPYLYVEDLRNIPGVTEPLYQALAPHLTPHSEAYDVWYDESNRIFGRLPVNEASLGQIHEALLVLYPRIDTDLLLQFAHNIVDSRDEDSIPTTAQGANTVLPLLGLEMTPLISEVCPDVITFESDGDNGEYIELFNPLSVSVDMRGWRLDYGNGRLVLNEVIGAGQVLVITDNINNENKPEARTQTPGMGTFFAVFGALPVGGRMKILEIPELNIPNEAGVIRLYDAQDNLIDYLTYKDATFRGNHFGWRRTTRMDRVGRRGPATPFQVNLENPATRYDQRAWEYHLTLRDKPFESGVELLFVPLPSALRAHLDDRASGRLQTDAHLFPDHLPSKVGCIDIRLVDAFTIAPFEKADKVPAAEILLEGADAVPVEAVLRRHLETDFAPRGRQFQTASPAEQPRAVSGRINLNTAPERVLGCVPGLGPAQVSAIVRHRQEFQERLTELANAPEPQSVGPWDSAPFQSLSDFASNRLVWLGTADPFDRLQALSILGELVVFNSNTFQVHSSNVSGEIANGAPVSQVACRATLSVTPAGVRILDWRSAP
jgi:type II secretory pathway component PulK